MVDRCTSGRRRLDLGGQLLGRPVGPAPEQAVEKKAPRRGHPASVPPERAPRTSSTGQRRPARRAVVAGLLQAATPTRYHGDAS